MSLSGVTAQSLVDAAGAWTQQDFDLLGEPLNVATDRQVGIGQDDCLELAEDTAGLVPVRRSAVDLAPGFCHGPEQVRRGQANCQLRLSVLSGARCQRGSHDSTTVPFQINPADDLPLPFAQLEALAGMRPAVSFRVSMNL